MDRIGDFLTRVRNAGSARHEKVDVPSSNVRVGIAEVLKGEGYIRSYKVVKDGRQGVMRLYLKYDEKGSHIISMISRISRPGKRVYVAAAEIPKVRSGFGISILSTNKGILSGEKAAAENVGGELICTIW